MRLTPEPPPPQKKNEKFFPNFEPPQVSHRLQNKVGFRPLTRPWIHQRIPMRSQRSRWLTCLTVHDQTALISYWVRWGQYLFPNLMHLECSGNLRDFMRMRREDPPSCWRGEGPLREILASTFKGRQIKTTSVHEEIFYVMARSERGGSWKTPRSAHWGLIMDVVPGVYREEENIFVSSRG